ncbi:MAG: SPASM domain-containing protein [Elusimicrobiota bacterium]
MIVVPDLNLPFEAGESIFHSDLLSYCAGDPGWDREKLQKVLSRYTSLVAGSGRKDIFCDLGVGNFSVDTRGRIWPCHILCNKGEPLGTIADDWGVIANRYKSGMGKDLKKSKFPECGSCFLKDYCTGCPMAWQRNNGRMAPNSSQCETDRRAYLTAFRLSLDAEKAVA